MACFETHSVRETESVGATLAAALKPNGGRVVAMFGGLGMGKTAFVRGMADGLGLNAEVSSPTFALVQDYGGNPPLVHFDMYRIETWDDLYATGFFDYIDMGAILAVEWSEQIEGALPDDAVRVTFERLSDDDRRITVEGVAL
ncbi:MAG: tRNA (adenosine(37)-N6)-threonylcarbamoyltransferase complex ATPase subunit type 1 TsaE [Clostridia bacterium]|nr:tRNA (adenosine(37)-N6)-threonylcarbamoyltransferase complex ATPase subunit type 1 TsaE [Clostridia bacterium]